MCLWKRTEFAQYPSTTIFWCFVRMNQFMVESPLQVLLNGAGLASKGISFESHHASYYSGQILSEDRIVFVVFGPDPNKSIKLG
ncbi:hypothetical protein RHGRI_026844 [Rhododendron griersonianum]|uniref:Uncharacterized protein n=1 Tax=Rhododendron griersonianum TaxID=479676 RepID=A0AAV6IXS8_9ERIC|nr:hypothetical protein RHGRI_026844 [Rhododendron griersonianum]